MSGKSVVTATLATAVVAAFLSLAIPLFVSNPFHVQGDKELQLALWILRWHPWIEFLTATTGLAAFALLRRGLIAVMVIAACISLDHVDVFALVFHRMDQPQFDSASRAPIAATEPVLAISISGAARAYPVRALAYHHVVNDNLGRVPIAATW